MSADGSCGITGEQDGCPQCYRGQYTEVLSLCRLMVRVESPENRMAALSVIEVSIQRCRACVG